ncbi:hypothetical protein [Veillonella caviae]|uniref:hypothetical protein n=1 Tax=Veillonella caviae TaxID=248316 RepID=UPI002A90B1B8|nr:hypothetical protein [Veillonella caviae]MDY5408764.1 hypothetical protein [Veillonella caviae]
MPSIVHNICSFLRWLFTPSKGLTLIAKILGLIGFLLIPFVSIPILVLAVVLYLIIYIPIVILFGSQLVANIAGCFVAICSLLYFIVYTWHELYGESTNTIVTHSATNTVRTPNTANTIITSNTTDSIATSSITDTSDYAHKPVTYKPSAPTRSDVFFWALLATYIGHQFWDKDDS